MPKKSISRPSGRERIETTISFGGVYWYYRASPGPRAGSGLKRVVVEELNQVTQPSYSPPAWRNLCSRGRHRGVRILGASQRPASVDKDFIGNMTECYAGRLLYRNDWRSLEPFFCSKSMQLATLKKPGQLHWKS